MNTSQAQELFTLITTVRHVKEMHVHFGANAAPLPVPGCLLCEGVRHGLYTEEQGNKIDTLARSGGCSIGFDIHFGCTEDEACEVLFHNQITTSKETTGENYYQASKELLLKYGYKNLFETTLSFATIMKALNQPSTIEVT